MEVREYFEIIKRQRKTFLITLVGVIAFGMSGYFLIPVRYKVNMELNITRIGYQKNTTDYRYDEFYRLQADERFADTVVRWIESPLTQKNILQKSGFSEFKKLRAARLSSQMVEVTFLVDKKTNALPIAKAVSETLNEKTAKLNKYQHDPNWFIILSGTPIVSEYKWGILKFFAATVLLGLFIALWTVFLRHYFKQSNR